VLCLLAGEGVEKSIKEKGPEDRDSKGWESEDQGKVYHVGMLEKKITDKKGLAS